MNIGIIGSGNMGKNLARLWAEKGHNIYITSNEPEQTKAVAESIGRNISPCSVKELADNCGVIVFAFPYESLDDVLSKTGTLSGKTIINIINPLTPDLLGLQLGFDTSASEVIAQKMPGANIVTAFNTVPSPVFESKDYRYGEKRSSVFYCGDDKEAKSVVHGLIEDIGFEAVDSGPLTNARFIEPMGEFVIQLAFGGLGANIALKLMKNH
jgi:predicted dinucleotide-binding enzyme